MILPIQCFDVVVVENKSTWESLDGGAPPTLLAQALSFL
jgi:hypothetical protein